MQTEPGLATQYLSTTLIISPNQSPNAYKCFASDSPLIVITIADFCLLPVFCCSLNWLLFINQRGRVFNCILVDDFTSYFSSSIFPSPKYLSSDILYTLSCCQCSSTSTPTIAGSIVFAARISIFDNRGTTSLALAFSVRSTDTSPDGKHLTLQNRVSNPSPAFCNPLFNANIKSASDFCCPITLREKKILRLCYSALEVDFADCCKFGLQFLYFT